MESAHVVNPLLPDQWALRCHQIRIDPDLVTIEVETMKPAVPCPLCDRPSGRVHSRYRRNLGDLPWQGCVVRWRLEVRKFFCDNADCRRRIFTERVPKVAAAYARNTVRLDAALTEIAFTGGGEAGSRLAGRLGMPISPDTLLRWIRRAPTPAEATPQFIGVDDWAVRRGQRYGTILCDLESHRPIDLLDDREAKTVADWLILHPGIRVITRDRASFYIHGASAGAPQAMQVADRFHLMQNLREAMTRVLERRYPHVVAAAQGVAAASSPLIAEPAQAAPPNQTRARRLPRRATLREVRQGYRAQRYEKVIDLHKLGISDRAIAKQMRIHRETVARYVQAGQLPERTPRLYASRTDPYTAYLLRRWNEGCHNAAQLHRELSSEGGTVSYCSVRRRVARWDRHCIGNCPGEALFKPQTAAPPSAKRLAWSLLSERDELDDRRRVLIEALFRRCPEVATASSLARKFVSMLRQRRGERLDDWIQCAWDRNAPRELRVFATGLQSDYAAVKAALTTDWSNGQVEGQVNRLKLIKRQMYGRAKFDLLRKRVLHAG
jgi:transposase